MTGGLDSQLSHPSNNPLLPQQSQASHQQQHRHQQQALNSNNTGNRNSSPSDAHSQLCSLSLSPTPEFSSPRSVSSLVPLSTHNSPTRSTGTRTPWSPTARKRSFHYYNHKQDVTGSSSLSTSPKASTRSRHQPSQPNTVADYVKAREQRNKEDYKVALEKLQQSSLDDDMLSSFKRESFLRVHGGLFSSFLHDIFPTLLILSSHTSVTRSGRWQVRRGHR